MTAASTRHGIRAGILAFSLAFIASAQEAQPPTPAIEYTLAPAGLHVIVGSTAHDLPLPDCEPKAIAREESRVYVACGASGVMVLDATDPRAPKVSMRVPTDGDAVALLVVDGKVWVELARREARPMAALTRAAQPVTAPPPQTVAPAVAPAQAPSARPDSHRSLSAPPRRSGIWELELGTHLFLPLGNIGFGALNTGSIAYRMDVPGAIYAELSPLGVGFGKQGTIGSAAGHAIVALDTHLFEAGLGVGGATINSPSGDATSSISFAQDARIGARDGLALFFRSNIVVDKDQFALGGLSITGQAALSERWWLLIRGGGGPVGFAFGDLGVRYLVSGDLGPGSLFLVGTAGGAGVFKKRACTFTSITQITCGGLKADYAGPAIGLGLEWRF